MTKAEIENNIFEFVKTDYEAFINELKANNNYDFFKSMDKFARRVTFLKSAYSHGIEHYRNCVYDAIFGCSYRATKSFTFENYEKAIKSGYYYAVNIDKYIQANPIFELADDKAKELILSKTIFKDFKDEVEIQVKRTVSDVISKVIFYGRE